MILRFFGIIVIYLIAGNCTFCNAQENNNLKKLLLQRISTHQNHNDSAFMEGLFPSYIEKKNQLLVPDNNIYFTALIAYTLNSIKQDLEKTDWQTIEQVNANADNLYPHFRNTKGRFTYNFWRTDKTFVFPYRSSPNEKKDEEMKRLPDDFDDTVMILLAMNVPDSVAKSVHKLMQAYTNSKKTKVRGAALSSYRDIPAYSVWFGKKFPVIFDVCVSANILSFVNTYNLSWTQADSATLNFIVQTIKNKDHINKPVYIAPYYARTSIILYHVARLMSIKPVPALEAIKPTLINDALEALKHADTYMEKVILYTCLYRWGQNVPKLELPESGNIFEKLETPSIPFFVGNLPSYFPAIIQKPLVMTNSLMYNHYCPAYYNALFLEYLVFKEKAEKFK